MRSISIKTAAASLAAIAVAGCTTTGVGVGQSLNGQVNATFSWTETAGTHGVMTAHLSDGRVFQGEFFQITQEAYVDYGPLWAGWGPGWGWGHGWGGHAWGWGWGGWGPWGPETVTQYSGQVLANLRGPTGFMRCHFTLQSPSSGLAGGGLGQCQLPNSVIIDAQFLRHY